MMSVLIREDNHDKDFKGGKKHSVHVTTFITSFIYMYVHGDLDHLDHKLQARP